MGKAMAVLALLLGTLAPVPLRGQDGPVMTSRFAEASACQPGDGAFTASSLPNCLYAPDPLMRPLEERASLGKSVLVGSAIGTGVGLGLAILLWDRTPYPWSEELVATVRTLHGTLVGAAGGLVYWWATYPRGAAGG